MSYVRTAVIAAGLVALLAIGVPAESKHQKRSRRSRALETTTAKKRLPRRVSRSRKPQSEARESVSDESDEVEERQSWFMRQRLYPFGSIPQQARVRAWAERPLRAKGLDGIESTSAVWSPLGPMPTRPITSLFDNFGYNSGRINAIAVSPVNPQIILVGGSTGGVWRSIDGGNTFTPVTDSHVDLAVGAIAFAPSNPNIVYVGMGDMHSCCDYLGSGVLKSIDAGATWTKVNNATLPQPASVGDIEVDPHNPNRIYLALYRSLDASNANSFPYGGVYISNDGGVNWARVFAGLPRDLAINPANPQIIYAAMRGVGTSGNGGTGGLYRSTNGGANWNVTYTSPYPAAFATNGLRDIRIAVSPANALRVYVYLGNGSSGSIRLAVSNDGGATFPTDTVLTTVDKGQFAYNTFLQADPTNADTVYIGARDVYRSTDGGTNWTNLTNNFSASFSYQPNLSKAHPDQHSIAFASANTFFIGNDGGLYKTTNGGSTFQSLNTSLSLTQFVSLARHPTDATKTYGGTQDNGTQRRTATREWQDISSGDGGYLVFNAADPSMFFGTYVHGTIWRFTNNGASLTTVATDSDFKAAGGTEERTAFYAPLTGNGTTAQIYFGAQRVWTSTDLGATWSAMGTTDLTRGGSDVLSAIGVAKSNRNVVYTGSEMGQAMVSTNAGQNWIETTNGLPNRFITSIKVDYTNPAVAYLTVSGFGSGHVFKTTNTGASWTDISGVPGQGGLPNIPVNTLLIDVNNPNLLYVGTDVGVFRSTTGGTTWSTFNDGMPPAIVTALTTNNSGQIQAGTYGRGAYEVSIASVASISGRVLDGFGNPISGATVSLSGSQAGNTTSDANGNYSFASLGVGGSYTLSPSKAGQFTGFARTVTGLASDTAGFDLQLTPFVVVNIHANDSGGNSLSNVAITVSGQTGSPLTNGAGNLNLNLTTPISGLQVTLTPIKLGYGFNPLTYTFNTSSGNQNVTFTAIPPNAIDTAVTFVRQQYSDFLDRDPDQGGLDYWTGRITECGTDQLCIHSRRIDTSAAFFVEAEFQRTGSFVYRLFKGGLGRRPSFSEFTSDRAQVIEGPNLEQTKQALTLAFVGRAEFVNKFAGKSTAETFVDAVILSIQQNSAVNLNGIRPSLLTAYASGGGSVNLSRARAIRVAIDESLFTTAEYNSSFVLMQYFGYLRRDPDQGGYDFWLNILNNREPNNYRAMVCAFITSAEYQQRFGTSVTRTNRDCGN